VLMKYSNDKAQYRLRALRHTHQFKSEPG